MNREAASARSRIAGNTRAAKYTKAEIREQNKPARRAFFARFEAEVDPHGELEPEERQRRATAAMKAYMARLSFQRIKAERERQQDALIDDALGLEAKATAPRRNMEVPNGKDNRLAAAAAGSTHRPGRPLLR